MFWSILAQIVSFLLDLATVQRRFNQAKDLEILVLRHQLRVLQRRLPHPSRPSRWEKLTLAILAIKLRDLAPGLRTPWCQSILLFKPDTILRWHRQLVRQKWIFRQRTTPGRPSIAGEIEDLIVQLARENPRWGYSRVHGELCKLGYTVGRSTIRDILKHHRIHPAPHRGRQSVSWRAFLSHYRHQILACDFFTVETLFMRTVYVLFFIELGRRRIHLAGCTRHPNLAWVTQQARQLSWHIQDSTLPVRFLIHDRNTRFCRTFDTVFRSKGVSIINTPYHAPNANAVAERWIRSIREECLDHLVILHEHHLHSVLVEYRHHFNHRRPHQGLNQQCPVPVLQHSGKSRVHRRDVLGGIIHDYYRDAAWQFGFSHTTGRETRETKRWTGEPIDK